jgi:hypothetical protein
MTSILGVVLFYKERKTIWTEKQKAANNPINRQTGTVLLV